jgi:cystathionine beta-lyase/cystathionine gamma-synthase
MQKESTQFATRAVHAGQEPDPVTGAVITPIYQTSTYAQTSPGVNKGYEYGRTGNPTRSALEANIAALEEGRYGFAFGSGMAATAAIAGLLHQGEHMIVTDNVYGGTYRYFQQVMTDYGLEFSFVDTTAIAHIDKARRANTRMVFLETPTNPMLRLADIKAVAEYCRQYHLLLAVDNTFMSPYFQRPLRLGADIVLHSSTKYLNGHSDVIGGITIVNAAQIAERLAFLQNAVGAVPSAFDCWLILRSTKTLHLRMRQHNFNAIAIAEFLTRHSKISTVNYPGLAPGFGGMISFETGSFERGKTLMESVRILTLAESLGGVESLISHPASMTHASVPRVERQKYGLTDGLVRLSVGVEAVADLIKDLEQALEKI